MNVASGSAFDLYSIAYRRTRDHLDRVRLPTFLQSAVQKIIAANGSSWSDRQMFCRRKAFGPQPSYFPLPEHRELVVRLSHSGYAIKARLDQAAVRSTE
jgi:hypothetical protein